MDRVLRNNTISHHRFRRIGEQGCICAWSAFSTGWSFPDADLLMLERFARRPVPQSLREAVMNASMSRYLGEWSGSARSADGFLFLGGFPDSGWVIHGESADCRRAVLCGPGNSKDSDYMGILDVRTRVDRRRSVCPRSNDGGIARRNAAQARRQIRNTRRLHISGPLLTNLAGGSLSGRRVIRTCCATPGR